MSDKSETPLGCGPEGSVSQFADLLNTLEDMAGSYAYAVRREELRAAGRAIMRLERELAAAKAERDALREQIKFPPPKGTIYGDPETIKALWEDAGRYRWLRGAPLERGACYSFDGLSLKCGAELDAAIDAERAK